MTLNFKYNIGDKVFLTKIPDYRYWSRSPFRNEDLNSSLPKEYEVNGYGFEDTGDGPKPYYRLHAYCDSVLTYHNQVTENCLEPAGECHPLTIESDVLSKEGRVIKIGDQIFEGMYRKNYGEETYRPNVGYTFAGHGTVIMISYFMEKNRNRPNIEVTYRRDFLCTYAGGKECLDARKYGYECRAYPDHVSYGVDENYPEEFAMEASKKENEAYLQYDAYDIEQWLTYLGIYDETMAKVKEWQEKRKNERKRKKKEKKSEEELQDKKLAEFLDTLTEEEKKKLKEML